MPNGESTESRMWDALEAVNGRLERLNERLTRMEGKQDTLSTNIEAGDNAIRQLIKFHEERLTSLSKEVAGNEQAIQAAFKRIDNMTSKDEFTGSLKQKDVKVAAMDQLINDHLMEHERSMGGSEVWKDLRNYFAPVVTGIILALVLWILSSLPITPQIGGT